MTGLAAAMSACVPFPHAVTLSPEISGVVEISGRPIGGASVVLAAGPESAPCAAVIQAVDTASDGSFFIPSRRELRLFYVPLVAPVSVAMFTVCVRSERGAQLGYRDFSPMSEGAAVMLRCDPSRPRPLRGVDMLTRVSICETLRRRT